MPILSVEHVQKVYTTRYGAQKVHALKEISFTVEAGEYVAIMGESGSGKTTLLNILAALDSPTSGHVLLEGRDFAEIPERQLSAFRRDNLGFVFQDNNLLPMVLQGTKYGDMEKRLSPLARLLNIEDILAKFPYEVSGGQKQRTAVARALITNPRLVLADEPTGALDSKAAQNLMRMFQNINKAGQTILMVTHSAQAASHAGRVLFIKDGQLFNQMYRGQMSQDAFYQKIVNALTALASGGDEA